MDAVDEVIYAALADDPVIAGLTLDGVHRYPGPIGTGRRWVAYRKIDGSDDYTFSTRSHEALLYQVVAVVADESAEEAYLLAAAADDVLTDSELEPEGMRWLSCRRSRHVDEADEQAGLVHQFIGGMYEIVVSEVEV